MKRKSLYLPIEIKARELNSKILLGSYAAEKGFRVYIGTKPAIYKMLLSKKFDKGGIFFYKSANMRSNFKKLSDSFDSFVVLDEEMGVAVKDPGPFYNSRISHEKRIDKYFVISEKHKNIVEKIRPEISDKVCVTGWPRVDLWRSDFDFLYKKEIEIIKYKYNNFYLYSSDFGFLNKERIEEETKRYKDIKVIEENKKLWIKSKDEFEAFVTVLHDLDGLENCPQIIIRPHPSEDHAVWLAACKGLKNISVIYEGEITPWLLASKALIHRGCTTAVQAYVANKRCIFFEMPGYEYTKESLPYKVSVKAETAEELLQKLQDESIKSREIDKKYFDLEISISNEFAYEKIIYELLSIPTVLKTEAYQDSFFSILKDIAKEKIMYYLHFLGLSYSKRKAQRILRKTPNGIKKDEINSKLDLFSNGKLKCKKAAHNLFVIESNE